MVTSLLLLVGCHSGGKAPGDDVPDDTGAPEAGCTAGLDMDGDGVCDREAADWSAGATVTPGEGRANIYGLSADDLATARAAGLQHVFHWPVPTTRMLLPLGALRNVFTDPDAEVVRQVLEATTGFSDEDGMYARMGLSRFPDGPAAAAVPPDPDHPGDPTWAPPPPGQGPGDPMGATWLETDQGLGLTFSCAACHVGTLFGTPVVGLQNKRPRPNALFHVAATALSTLDGDTFQQLTDATDGERAMYEETIAALGAVGTLPPVALGLDTSLAQVAGSLARRRDDADASFDAGLEASPRALVLDEVVGDSKPMPWWTMKHKTRWLSDGSIVAGNPILTNFLWNELGRGADLPALQAWLESDAGMRVVDELTVTVFATEAPRWTDFFGAESIDEDRAQAGQLAFEARCARCHGSYDKGWDADDADARSPADRLATTAVRYHPQTPRVDVGTDSGRATGMVDLEALNALAVSQWMQTTVDASEAGYVPPPLDGIWARYPYFHNNAAPTLCDVLRPPAERTAFYVQGPADDPETDFDAACVGYPTGAAIPEAWLDDTEAHVTLGGPGQSPAGHDEMLDDLDEDESMALIEFLKTL